MLETGMHYWYKTVLIGMQIGSMDRLKQPTSVARVSAGMSGATEGPEGSIAGVQGSTAGVISSTTTMGNSTTAAVVQGSTAALEGVISTVSCA